MNIFGLIYFSIVIDISFHQESIALDLCAKNVVAAERSWKGHAVREYKHVFEAKDCRGPIAQ